MTTGCHWNYSRALDGCGGTDDIIMLLEAL